MGVGAYCTPLWLRYWIFCIILPDWLLENATRKSIHGMFGKIIDWRQIKLFPLVGKQGQNILQVLSLKWHIYVINLNIFDHFTDKYWEISESLISQQAKIRIFNSSISPGLSIRLFHVSVNSLFCPLPKLLLVWNTRCLEIHIFEILSYIRN